LLYLATAYCPQNCHPAPKNAGCDSQVLTLSLGDFTGKICRRSVRAPHRRYGRWKMYILEKKHVLLFPNEGGFFAIRETRHLTPHRFSCFFVLPSFPTRSFPIFFSVVYISRSSFFKQTIMWDLDLNNLGSFFCNHETKSSSMKDAMSRYYYVNSSANILSMP
jgi:hypothetical protein